MQPCLAAPKRAVLWGRCERDHSDTKTTNLFYKAAATTIVSATKVQQDCCSLAKRAPKSLCGRGGPFLLSSPEIAIATLWWPTTPSHKPYPYLLLRHGRKQPSLGITKQSWLLDGVWMNIGHPNMLPFGDLALELHF